MDNYLVKKYKVNPTDHLMLTFVHVKKAQNSNFLSKEDLLGDTFNNFHIY
ncbi:hypothetical protein [Enterococcus faecium]